MFFWFFFAFVALLLAGFGAHTRAQPTCAVPVVPRPEQGTGLLILPVSLPLVLPLVGEGVNALVPAGVTVRVVDDHVVCGDGKVDPQLVAGQAALGLGRQEEEEPRLPAGAERRKSPLHRDSKCSGTVWAA